MSESDRTAELAAAMRREAALRARRVWLRRARLANPGAGGQRRQALPDRLEEYRDQQRRNQRP